MDVSERLKCLVLHARSGDKLIDICDILHIQYLTGTGILSRVINLRRRIDIHGDHQAAEKIKKTSILSGSFQAHEVVVKKILKEKNNDYSKTLELHRRFHDLDGVVKPEIDESDDYHYLAFKVCSGNLKRVFLSDKQMGIFMEEAVKINMMRYAYRSYEDTIMYKFEMRDMRETLLYMMTAGEYVFKDKGRGYYEKLVTDGYSLPKGEEMIAYKGPLRPEFLQLIETFLDPK
ncbi:hypothetical protein CTI12_AA398390 [Artemisia annua]|uniref:Uncharacterized protein n=1 Tax=Artemisia annua TaxID=35608 RepID=A0A2U1MBK4_ARTAN|nr:hypothetical protein CTI12_AA398390 [Artemisia annua]